jgi:hypothetical protein
VGGNIYISIYIFLDRLIPGKRENGKPHVRNQNWSLYNAMLIYFYGRGSLLNVVATVA